MSAPLSKMDFSDLDGLTKYRHDNSILLSNLEATICRRDTQIGNLEAGLHKIIKEAPAHGEDRSYLTAKETLDNQFDERSHE